MIEDFETRVQRKMGIIKGAVLAGDDEVLTGVKENGILWTSILKRKG